MSGFLAVLAVGFFCWMCMTRNSPNSSSGVQNATNSDSESERARTIGTVTGLLGGDIKDAVIADFTLTRNNPNHTNEDMRDIGTAISMQVEQND